jgi:TonB family protein
MFAVPALSVDDLRTRVGDIDWFESVAVVAELAAATAALGETRLPELAAIGLTATGDAAIAPRLPAADTAVRQLGRALDALISESAAPEPLRQLAAFAKNAPADEPLEQFAAALHYYERPNRSQILRNLVARFVTPGQDVDVEAELARLRQRAADRARNETASRPKRDRRLSRILTSRWVLWPAALALLAGGGALAYWKVPATRAAVSSSWAWAKSFTAAADTAPAPEDEPKAKASPPRMTSVASRAPGAASSTPSAPAISAPPETASATQTPLLEPAPEAVAAELPGNAVVTLVTEPAGPPPAPPVPPADGIYTSATPGITPPVPLRRSIATEPDPSVAQEAGILELVIDEAGSVERVRLVSSSGRFQDRMLLSAAKAWRFKPATLDGKPVRFRTQVRLTW